MNNLERTANEELENLKAEYRKADNKILPYLAVGAFLGTLVGGTIAYFCGAESTGLFGGSIAGFVVGLTGAKCSHEDYLEEFAYEFNELTQRPTSQFYREL